METSDNAPVTTALGAAWRFGRDVPAMIRTGLTTNPIAVVAAIGAGGFLAGAIVGSRLGRAIALVCIGVGLDRFFTDPTFAPRSHTIPAP
jgi:hypothetical protein